MAHEVATRAAIKVAVVGVGYWGKNLVRNFHQLGVLAALCDPAPASEEVCRRDYPDVPFISDFRALIADPSIDAVALATPAITHYEMARAALEAGKHVFVEKPLAIDVRHGERLVEPRRGQGRVLMVRAHPPPTCHHQAAAAHSERRLGKINYLYSTAEHRQDPDGREYSLELRAA